MDATTIVCQVCGGHAHNVTWASHTARADYRCSRCRAGGAITSEGNRVGPIFEGTTEIATTILRGGVTA